MAYTEGRLVTPSSADWEALKLPRESMTAHLLDHKPGWTETLEYGGDDARLPEAVRAFNAGLGVESLVVAPLMLPTRNLGWVALSTIHAPVCEGLWRRALVEAMARQATLALHQSRLEEQRRQEERRQAVLEERNRIARDIHDTLAQGFAAILMQLQSVQRAAPSLPAAAAASLESAVELARTHMIDARRSVCALRPQDAGEGDLAALLTRIADLARRTTDLPVDLALDALPPVPAAIAHEIATIAQEALTNAIRHARARRIRVTAHAQRGVALFLSVADDGRGMTKERRGYGFGMTSMQERADRIGASLTIVTAPRSGTDVVLAWEPPSFAIPELADAARR
jgi:signal transduction histidine kinase